MEERKVNFRGEEVKPLVCPLGNLPIYDWYNKFDPEYNFINELHKKIEEMKHNTAEVSIKGKITGNNISIIISDNQETNIEQRNEGVIIPDYRGLLIDLKRDIEEEIKSLEDIKDLESIAYIKDSTLVNRVVKVYRADPERIYFISSNNICDHIQIKGDWSKSTKKDFDKGLSKYYEVQETGKILKTIESIEKIKERIDIILEDINGERYIYTLDYLCKSTEKLFKAQEKIIKVPDSILFEYLEDNEETIGIVFNNRKQALFVNKSGDNKGIHFIFSCKDIYISYHILYIYYQR